MAARTLKHALSGFGLGFLVLAGLAGCSGDAGAPNVLLVILDTTRADALAVYGGRTRTPHLERLAERGVLFEDATAHNPFTLGSVASVFTSLPPDLHGIKGHAGFALAEDARTLAEIYREAGYATAGFVSAVPLRGETGAGQGFDVYDDDLSMPFPVYRTEFTPIQESLRGAQRRGDETVRRAAAWLDGERPERTPFFLAVHLFDPHEPYDPPPPFPSQYPGDPYAGEIAFCDALVGSLLQNLDERGLLDRTIICVVGDHGEAFHEHDEVGHGTFLYQTTLHVPWVLAGPGVPACRAEGQAQLIDVAPTLLAACGLPSPDSFGGRDLLASLNAADGASRRIQPGRPAYVETYYMRMAHRWSELLGWRDGSWKYVLGPSPELYDLASDPDELRNRIDEEPERARAMARALQVYLNRPSFHRLDAVAAAPDAQTAEQLRSLGYVGEAPSEQGELRPGWEIGLPDPKVAVVEWNQRQRAQAAARRGLAAFREERFEQALEWADESLGLDPDKLEAAKIRVAALASLDRNEEAEAEYRGWLERHPDDPDLWQGLGLALDKSGRPEEARAAYDHALELDPAHGKANMFRGYQLVREKAYEAAAPYYERAIASAPEDVVLRLELARLYRQIDEPARAAAALEPALTVEPRHPDVLLTLAQVRLDLGEPGKARRILEDFVRFHPAHPQTPRLQQLLTRLPPG